MQQEAEAVKKSVLKKHKMTAEVRRRSRVHRGCATDGRHAVCAHELTPRDCSFHVFIAGVPRVCHVVRQVPEVASSHREAHGQAARTVRLSWAYSPTPSPAHKATRVATCRRRPLTLFSLPVLPVLRRYSESKYLGMTMG